MRNEDDYRTASLRVLPALKDGTFIAGIEILSVGLRGFTPLRAARLETRKVPNPVIVTVFPRLSSLVMVPVRDSSARAAERLVIPDASANVVMRSCLDMDIGREGKKYENIQQCTIEQRLCKPSRALSRT